jgi:hypothetical protein
LSLFRFYYQNILHFLSQIPLGSVLVVILLLIEPPRLELVFTAMS